MEIGNQGNNEEETSNVSQEPQNYAPEFDDWVKEKPRTDYIRLVANEGKVMAFKSGKPDEMIMSNFGGKLSEPKPVARYMVTTPEKPQEAQAFDVTSKRLARDIEAYFNKGFKELEITRLNTNPVSYRVIPSIAREQQKQMAMGA